MDNINAYYQNVDNVDDARFLFKQMDHDGDGVLSQEELRRSGYSTVQYSTVQCSTVQYIAVQYSTVQYSTGGAAQVGLQYSTVH